MSPKRRNMESEIVTKQFLVQALGELEGHLTQRFESAIANAQAKTLYWMVGIFLAATALVGTSVSVYTMTVIARL